MSNIILTLDYELFFGSHSGTLAKSIITPVDRFLEICNKYNIKATFFVDAGYISKLIEYKNKYPQLAQDYKLLSKQLEDLNHTGHDIQLHIHPHWEDSLYDGNKWIMNTSRFKLNDFNDREISLIVKKYKNILNKFSKNIIAFRAGGWCIQPYDRLYKAFKDNNILIDSTVYYGGFDLTATHFYDFRNSPQKSLWKFEKDPLIENKNGFFTEIPISSCKVPPTVYWKLAASKIIKNKRLNQFGDGSPIYASGESILKKLFTFSHGVVSMDGIKAGYLETAFRKHKNKADNRYFVTIGHPKALSEYSLQKLENFIKKNNDNEFITIKNLKKGK